MHVRTQVVPNSFEPLLGCGDKPSLIYPVLLMGKQCRRLKTFPSDSTVRQKDIETKRRSASANVRKEISPLNQQTSMTTSRPRGDDRSGPSEQAVVAGLGLVLFRALDFGIEEDEERHLSPELTRLIQNMTAAGMEDRQMNEMDDEGIERDAGDSFEDSNQHHSSSLSLVLQECTVHLGYGGSQEADSHYKAVCRALVTEALELSTFLENVGTGQLRQQQEAPDHLGKLNFNDWARLWVQVIRELRMGVQLKKVCYTRKPIEFELTPYEILMEDIRARRYKLNKVMIDGNIPQRVKKDAHAIILEFIRSRPPLKKASERKLNPPKLVNRTPRENLLESIKQGHAKLFPIKRNAKGEKLPEDNEAPLSSKSNSEQVTRNSRRLIKVDYSHMSAVGFDVEDKDLDATDDGDEEGEEGDAKNNPWQRTGSLRLSQAEIDHYCDTALQPYDLATQCPSKRASMRRHTVVVCETGNKGSLSVPQSRPTSRQTNTPTDESLSCTLPEMTWSRTSLQDDLLKSKQWQEECLSLTLEEIVHIRSVLTKAELESLPVEGRVKEDAERRKVCFLCMKTRFGIFGPWGQICKLCKRTVCAKCYSKMRIPTEHFSHVPVVALSPSMLSPSEADDSFPRALVTKLMATERSGVGSAPTSPKISRSAPPSQMSTSLISDGPISLPPSSPLCTPSDKYAVSTSLSLCCFFTKLFFRWRMAKSKTVGRQKAEKLKGLQMTVCHDCKTMVLQIIKSSRTTRNMAIRNLTLDLSPVY
ncbi:protein spire isoform X2 [Cimex lectularius]|uniref:KIND domain-containing protein n=1 Tax=Cimex lectularius TaxID=79782 RepID=A0A8I6SD99_CIMLE|nr:protein spire isoform X2 [Cimex lectularius]